MNKSPLLRTDDEKLAFLEGYNTCLGNLRTQLDKGDDLQEVITRAEATAQRIKSTLPETYQF
jgi:hypothetical protein